MHTQARWRRMIQGLLVAGALCLVATGLALQGSPGEAGEALVFRSPDGSVSLAVVNGDKIDIERLSDANQRVECISVASNGRCVWVVCPKDGADVDEGWRKYGPLDVYIIRGDLKHIPQHDPYAASLSPNGEQLVYIAETDGGAKHILCCIDLRTGKTESISDECAYLQAPSWSPSGTRIAYFGSTDIEGYRLHVVDMLAKKDMERSPPILVTDSDGNAMKRVVWSPDSSLIYFTSRHSDAEAAAADIATYEVSVVGSAPPRKIAKGQCYSISPDGKIVNISGRGYRVDSAEVIPAPLPDSMLGTSLLSPSGRVTAYRRALGKSFTTYGGSLWCKIREAGKEVRISDSRWDLRDHDWGHAWIILTTPDASSAGSTPPAGSGPPAQSTGMPGMPGMGTLPPPSPTDGQPPAQPARVLPPCEKLVMVANALRKSGKSAESLTPEQSAGLPEGWGKGLPLAIDFLKRGAPAAVPFAAWVMKIAPDASSTSPPGIINMDALRSAAFGIEQTGGKSLAGVFHLAVMLTAPESANPFDMNYLTQDIALITEADRAALLGSLSKRHVSTKMIYSTISCTTEIPWVQMWARDLAEAQEDSAFGGMISLGKAVQTGDRGQIRKQIKRLSRAHDWDYVWDDWYSQSLLDQGMRDEAIQLLDVISTRGVGYMRSKAGVKLSKLTGKAPKQPSGPDANDSSKWIEIARTNQSLGRTSDARAAALKAVNAARKPYEKACALRIMAEIDPEKALDLAGELMPEFLRVDTNNDSYGSATLYETGHALYLTADARRSLAPQVAALMKRLSEHGINAKNDLAKELALVDIWAGDFNAGVQCIVGSSHDPLQTFCAVMIRDGMPDAARASLLKGLKDYLSEKNPEPEKVEQAIRSTNDLNMDTEERMKTGQWISAYGDALSPVGMKALAATLWRYESTSRKPAPQALKLRALAGLPFPESLAKTGGPEGNVKPYEGAVRKGDPVKGSDPSGGFTTRTYTVAASPQKVVDYYRGLFKNPGGSATQEGRVLYADFTGEPAGYRVLVHIDPKGANQTEFTIKVYGTQ